MNRHTDRCRNGQTSDTTIGQLNTQTDEMDGQTDKQIVAKTYKHGWINRRTDRQVHEQMYRRINKGTDSWKDRRLKRKTDSRTER